MEQDLDVNSTDRRSVSVLQLPDESPVEGGRLRLRTLVLLRWIAIAGQTVAIVVVKFGLEYELPLALCLTVIGVSAASNMLLTLGRPPRTRLGSRDAAMLLGFDVIQLAVLLFLTGGLANPFAVLILAPVTVSATILSRRTTVVLLLLVFACVTLLAFQHWPLPWQPGALDLPFAYLLGIWTALSVAAVFVSIYVWSVAEEARRMSNALAETQASLAREQRVSALGGLAAAAAHELGSPLATIAVVAKELSLEVSADSPLAEDIALLLGQSDRCREILKSLTQRPGLQHGELDVSRLTLTSLAETAAAAHRDERVVLALRRADEASGDEPSVPGGPGVVHGVGNLIQNAVQFARTRVDIEVTWDAAGARIVISDDGPGFPSPLLTALGEPYVSGRESDSRHMGLGIFIALTLLERTGASLVFANRGGAEVSITWPCVGDRDSMS
jgi:two-component system sensor histidine kinase RegB